MIDGVPDPHLHEKDPPPASAAGEKETDREFAARENRRNRSIQLAGILLAAAVTIGVAVYNNSPKKDVAAESAGIREKSDDEVTKQYLQAVHRTGDRGKPTAVVSDTQMAASCNAMASDIEAIPTTGVALEAVAYARRQSSLARRMATAFGGMLGRDETAINDLRREDGANGDEWRRLRTKYGL